MSDGQWRPELSVCPDCVDVGCVDLSVAGNTLWYGTYRINVTVTASCSGTLLLGHSTQASTYLTVVRSQLVPSIVTRAPNFQTSDTVNLNVTRGPKFQTSDIINLNVTRGPSFQTSDTINLNVTRGPNIQTSDTMNLNVTRGPNFQTSDIINLNAVNFNVTRGPNFQTSDTINLNMTGSRDPDVAAANKSGLHVDVFCYPQSEAAVYEAMNVDEMRASAERITNNTYVPSRHHSHFT